MYVHCTMATNDIHIFNTTVRGSSIFSASLIKNREKIIIEHNIWYNSMINFFIVIHSL